MAMTWVRLPAERHAPQRSTMPPISHGPFFGHQEPRLGLGKVDDLAHGVVGEVDAVDLIRQLPCQPYSHSGMNNCNPYAAHSSRRAAHPGRHGGWNALPHGCGLIGRR
jgi:hypothetical protein